MGCGRVGASMATHLDRMGHSVAIIDQLSDAFRRLPAEFNGRKVKGVGFDRDALEQAGIDEAYAFAAVSNGDNSNIVAALGGQAPVGVLLMLVGGQTRIPVEGTVGGVCRVGCTGADARGQVGQA